MSNPARPETTTALKPLPSPVKKTCDLFRLLSGHELLGLTPGEIAKGLAVSPSWVSINLPALAAETGFVEQVPGTNRWRLGVPLVRIAVTVSVQLNQARRQLDELQQRYGGMADMDAIRDRYSR
ncbi:DNA-binding IclR family transcriptional regulator [Inhella inkyongensis]|uniref:DNA-binding IclR family transcriptional regulator n=1 Tax=Inhella inkyongensis TaxID=392593 RepID=A0A840S4E0_9BURK|nr:transcriptional regulator [Inhella inkyongensis]MBB5204422.1 DNA-binding IclR family transcriptional regulator [Inhella inkyongensis]